MCLRLAVSFGVTGRVVGVVRVSGMGLGLELEAATKGCG